MIGVYGKGYLKNMMSLRVGRYSNTVRTLVIPKPKGFYKFFKASDRCIVPFTYVGGVKPSVVLIRVGRRGFLRGC